MAFLDPCQAIVDRLLAQTWPFPVPVEVGTALDAGAIVDAPQTHPTVWVLYNGHKPTQEVGHGAVQQVRQHWHVVLKMRRASGLSCGTAEPLGAELGPLVDVVHAALCGFRPCPGFDALVLAEGTGVSYSTGYMYYELEFTTRTTVRGAP